MKNKDLAPLCRLHHSGLHEYASVRKNSYYQSRAYIESEREKYRSGNLEVDIRVKSANGAPKKKWRDILDILFG